MTPEQCKAARALLSWTQQDLADRSRASISSIRSFEGQTATPRPGTIALLEMAFTTAGVVFLDEGQGGVLLKQAAEAAA